VRQPIDGEFPAPIQRDGLSRWVVVHRLHDHARVRAAFVATAKPPMTEAAAARIFNVVMRLSHGTLRPVGGHGHA
jgi:hypothetical protein